ncbi:ribosomal protein S5 domain 2-type protein [Crepidotus variabilis]|uniref:Ribosomal protein S5 domain 2-type protein n=1 Tax=Crepidotus variabilis TaxID=179855 RepID=A0A9P6JSX7_9AGAR|nr:ribosomal protein S5 domain 2-type protein [Crepidotus variabilis]
MSSGHLDDFISAPSKSLTAIAVSPEIRDRGSLFVGTLYRATTPREAHANVAHVKHVSNRNKKATHDISAWRCMVLKPGKNGLGGPDDFELVQGSKDDGESWAGGKVLKVMQQMAVLDAVVIVSRWYGGTMLGPARFSHIETCATEVCKAFKRTEELQDCITTLEMLDDTLAAVRKKLAMVSTSTELKSDGLQQQTASTSESAGDKNPSAMPPSLQQLPSTLPVDNGLQSSATVNEPQVELFRSKKPTYNDLDIAKAKRLIQARDNAIKAVRNLIAKKEKEIESLEQVYESKDPS